jgi:hypothetical protein
MPGHALPRHRRPARAVLSKAPRYAACDAWGAAFASRRRICACIDPNANPNTSIMCNPPPGSRDKAKSWPHRPRGQSRRFPGISSRAGGTGPTGRSRTGPLGFRALRTFHISVHVRFRYSRVSGLRAFPCLVRFRPVRPAPSAWHEMPGHALPKHRRPARAVLSKAPQYAACDA